MNIRPCRWMYDWTIYWRKHIQQQQQTNTTNNNINNNNNQQNGNVEIQFTTRKKKKHIYTQQTHQNNNLMFASCIFKRKAHTTKTIVKSSLLIWLPWNLLTYLNQHKQPIHYRMKRTQNRKHFRVYNPVVKLHILLWNQYHPQIQYAQDTHKHNKYSAIPLYLTQQTHIYNKNNTYWWIIVL